MISNRVVGVARNEPLFRFFKWPICAVMWGCAERLKLPKGKPEVRYLREVQGLTRSPQRCEFGLGKGRH